MEFLIKKVSGIAMPDTIEQLPWEAHHFILRYMRTFL